MRLLSSCLLVACVCLSALAQYPRRPLPLVCPPALPVGVCYASCAVDTQCRGFYKCCPTACGGTVCSRPVTAPAFAQLKSGACPAVPMGPWVCSDRCSADEDCPGSTKCCRNRCGALACQLPQPPPFY